ncbi:hypothetical protein CO130_02305, partial [Candidatus Jorgensenbacteria bacterium CG_4_9_14_3_um_filter_38_10]
MPSNIAEGRFRGTKKDFLQFLRIAYSSSAELETQLEIAKRLRQIKDFDYLKVDSFLLEVMKLIKLTKLKANGVDLVKICRFGYICSFESVCDIL